MCLDTAFNKLISRTKSLTSMHVQLSGTIIGMFSSTDLLTTQALETMRGEANSIVYRITSELNDNYPCHAVELPDERLGCGKNDHKFSTQSNANKLEADIRTVSMIDQHLERHIDGIGPNLEPGEICALKTMRSQANSIVTQITMQLEDDYPC
jgi:hypothetical protein